MRKFIQVVPDVAVAFKKMFEIVEARGIHLEATDDNDETLHYWHLIGSDDDNMLIHVGAKFWSTTADKDFPPERVGEEIGLFYSQCGVAFTIAGDECLQLEVTYDPLDRDGWTAKMRFGGHSRRPRRHPLFQAGEKLAKHLGFREEAVQLSEGGA